MNQTVTRESQSCSWDISYITFSGGRCDVMCCLYFGSSQEIFALLKSPRMIKTESGCFCSVSVIRSVSFCKARLTCACG